MPEPLAMPPRRTVRPFSMNSTAISFGTVSVVMMARAAARLPVSGPSPLPWPSPLAVASPLEPPAWPEPAFPSPEPAASAAAASSLRPSAARALAMPASTLSMGSRTPMTPVEATATSCGAVPRASATSAAMRRASARPSGPVTALALPLLATTARSLPPATCSRVTCTGAACTLLVVNTAAAAAGTSDTMTATSLRLRLMPACTPAARKPAGAVTPPATVFSVPCCKVTWSCFASAKVAMALTPFFPSSPAAGRSPAAGALRIQTRRLETLRLFHAEHDVHVLHRLPGRSFDQIVNGRQHDDPAGARVHPGRHVAVVGAADGFRLRHAVFAQDPHEGLGAVILPHGRQHVGGGHGLGQRHLDGGQNAPAHGHQLRHEADADGSA